MTLPNYFTTHAGQLYDTRKPDWSANPLRPVYAQATPAINTTLQLRACLRYGDARLCFLCSDGGVLSRRAVLENYELVSSATRDPADTSGWRVVGCMDVDSLEDFTVCDHTGTVLFDPETESTLPYVPYQRAHTDTFIVEHANDYFAASLDNGGIRIGMLNTYSIDLHPDSPEYMHALSVMHDAEALEALADDCYSDTCQCQQCVTCRYR